MTKLSSEKSRFELVWARVSELAGIESVAPFVLSLPSGKQIEAAVLIKRIGAPNGMLIVDNYEAIDGAADELIAAGYGYSVMDEPGEDEEFVLDEYLAVLCDWGWSGDMKNQPDWMLTQ